MSTSTTIPKAGPTAGPSTNAAAPIQPVQTGLPRAPRVQVGDTVLVTMAEGVRRPMIVSGMGTVEIGRLHDPTPRRELRISGTIFCEPEDHLQTLIRSGAPITGEPGDPARIHGRPDRLQPMVYGEQLAEGVGVGQWQQKGGPR